VDPKGERYLTFVPDPGGFNNVRMGLENALVLARASGRTLVLPPPQRVYLWGDCAERCVFGLEELLPGLRRLPVVTAREFVRDRLPRLAAARGPSRYRRPRANPGGRLARAPESGGRGPRKYPDQRL